MSSVKSLIEDVAALQRGIDTGEVEIDSSGNLRTRSGEYMILTFDVLRKMEKLLVHIHDLENRVYELTTKEC